MLNPFLKKILGLPTRDIDISAICDNRFFHIESSCLIQNFKAALINHQYTLSGAISGMMVPHDLVADDTRCTGNIHQS